MTMERRGRLRSGVGTTKRLKAIPILTVLLLIAGCQSASSSYVLDFDEPKGFTPVFDSSQAVLDWERAGIGLVDEATARSHAMMVPNLTQVEVLRKVDRSGKGLGRAFFVQVRILAGEYVNRTGWVNGFWLKPTVP